MDFDTTTEPPESPTRPSAESMDKTRNEQLVHEYLCRVKEAREWIQACLKDKLPQELIDFEECLRNGVILARLANYVAPKMVQTKDIFDYDQSNYRDHGLHFRHTDNISRFLKMAEAVGLPRVFYPEIVDVYDKKNMPKTIYCIHALSIYLQKRFPDRFPTLTNVSGGALFSEAEVSAMAKEFAKYGITIPAFGKIGPLLADQVPADQVAMHAAVITINEAIEQADSNATFVALQNPHVYLSNVHVENENEYQRRLSMAQNGKRSANNVDDSLDYSVDSTDLYSHLLTRDEIQECIDNTNVHTLVNEVNNTVLEGDGVRLLTLLRHPTFELASIIDDYPQYYLSLLRKASSIKGAKTGEEDAPLTKEEICSAVMNGQSPLKSTVGVASLVVAINHLIELESDPNELLSTLSKLEDVNQRVGPILYSSIDAYNNDLSSALREKKKTNDGDWVAVAVEDSSLYANVATGEIHSAVPSNYDNQCKYLNVDEIQEVIQRSNERVNNEEERKKTTEAERDEAARRIQLFYKKHKARHNETSSNPGLDIVQTTPGLLKEIGMHYEEELELARTRKLIRKELVQHQNMETQLDELDLRIGLVVRNLVNIDKLVKDTGERARRPSGKKGANASETNGEKRPLLDPLIKSGRQRLHDYQNLLHLVTRNAKYLAYILVVKSPSDADPFIEKIMYPLFNYGKSSYEEYLLFRVFLAAVDEDVYQKVTTGGDIQTIQLASIDQLLKFILKDPRGDQYKHSVMCGLLEKLCAMRQPLDTNPIEVYKKWSSSTGAYKEVTMEEAYSHPEVKERIHESVTKLEGLVAPFMEMIESTSADVPYFLRYSCKALQSTLSREFPEEKPNSVIKATAGLLFSRFVHVCIMQEVERISATIPDDQNRVISPDDHDEVTSPNDQKEVFKTLANNVARLVHCAMVNKGYNDEYEHLVEFNQFIRKCHERFEKFFASVCNVPEPEEYYKVDEYTDYLVTTKPVVILLADLIELHKLLKEHGHRINRGSTDLVNVLFEDQQNYATYVSLGRYDDVTGGEVVLTSINRFSVPPEVDKKEFTLLETKKYFVDVLLCHQALSVAKALHRIIHAKDENKHNVAMEERREAGQQVYDKSTLAEKQKMTRLGLYDLEEEREVSSKDDYSTLTAKIARDYHTHERGSGKDRPRLVDLLEKLKDKSKYYHHQVDDYNLYYKECMNSLIHKSKKINGSPARPSPPKRVKYTADKLYQKGVLNEIVYTQRNSYKNVHFDIHSVSEPDVFEIFTDSFNSEWKEQMDGWNGINIEQITESKSIKLTELLQLEFEETQEITLFEKTKWAVTPFIGLLNKKFFAKHK